MHANRKYRWNSAENKSALPKVGPHRLMYKTEATNISKKCSWLGDERERFRSGRAFGLQLEREEK